MTPLATSRKGSCAPILPKPTPPVSTKTPGSERRIHERRLLRTDAQVVLTGNQGFRVRTVDISQGGMLVVAPFNLKSGAVVNIQLALPMRAPRATPFEARAQVVHSVLASGQDGFKVGLKFIALTPASAAAVTQYLTPVAN